MKSIDFFVRPIYYIIPCNIWITDQNNGRRIGIGHYNSDNVTDYIYAAHRIQSIRTGIRDAFMSEGTVWGAREVLLSEFEGINNNR